MGRSPFYAEHVRPIKKNKPIKELEEIFSYFFQSGDIIVYEDDIQVATLKSDVCLEIMESQQTLLPILERCCSIYRKREDYFPEKDKIYRINSAIIYRFCNKHSEYKPFEFHVLELENINKDYYTTFCLMTDGSLLNLESLSLRGYVLKIKKL